MLHLGVSVEAEWILLLTLIGEESELFVVAVS